MMNYNPVISQEKIGKINYYHALKKFLGVSEKIFEGFEIVTLEERRTFLENMLGSEDLKKIAISNSDSWNYFGKSKIYVSEAEKPNFTRDRF